MPRVFARIAAAVALLCVAATAHAESKAPASKPATIAVVGDSLGDGLWGGIARTLSKAKQIKVYRGAKNSVGFTGSNLTDMLDRAFAASEPDALVMMIGANDRRSLFVDGKPKALLHTPAWEDLYRERVERFMDHAGQRKVPLLWVLLPVMRAADATEDARIVNRIVTEAARGRQHVHVIDIWALTADEKGAYQPHFKDLSGTVRQMRLGDGVHFEMPAYELFADLVLKTLKDASPAIKSALAE